MVFNISSSSMPVLGHLKRVFQAEFGEDFAKLPNRDNTLFVIIQHGFISIRPMMEAFLELGIHTDQVFMTTKPHTTPTYPDPIPPAKRHPDDMLYYFKNNFKHYVPFQWTTTSATLAQSDALEAVKKSRYKVLTDLTHDKLFEDFCNYLIRYPDLPNRRIENIIICDEGGKFLSKFIERYHRPSSTARRNLNDYHVVAIEHTKCGTYRPELNNLPFPLINMADSYLKTHVESQFIAESMFVHLNAILQRLVNSSSMIIGVVGGGNIGKEVLVFLSEKYTSIPVIIFDRESNVLPSSEITELGWGNVRREETIEALFQQATIILGCTGKDFMAGLSTDYFARNQANHIHLVSCSSGDTEFNTLLQQMPDYKFESLKDIRDYTMSDVAGEKLITLYNGGFPMNFLIQQPAGLPVEETVPLEQVQITRSMKLAAIVQALKLLEVTAYFPKKYDNSLKDYMKLEVMYQWEIVQAFYHHLMKENPHTQLQIADGSMGIHQPTMSSVLNIPYYITTHHQVTMQSQLLKQNDVAIRRLVIHGTTGSGKTTLAQHYLQKYRIQYPEHLNRVIVAETAQQWRDHLQTWAEDLFPGLKALLIAETNSQRQESMIDQRLQAALCEKKWCIVIDNWDQDQLLFKRIEDLFLCSNVGHGVLLITTQGESPYADPDRSLDLSLGLMEEESQKLLIKVMNLEKTTGMTWQQLGSEAELASLTQYLNHLPLALVVAGSYLLWENKSLPRSSQTPFTYSNYKNLLELQVTELIRIHKEKLGKKGDIPREEAEEFIRIKTQEAAVNLSLKKAIQTESTHPNMNLWQLLCFCGFLASDGIPQQLLKDYIEQILPENEREIYETFFEMLLQEAQKYSLLQFESRLSAVDSLPRLHMHRVIQKVLRDNYWHFLLETMITFYISTGLSMESSKEDQILREMQNALKKRFTPAVQNKSFGIIREYLSHVETWCNHKLNREFTIPEILMDNTTLQRDLSYANFQLGDYVQSEKLSQEVLAKRIKCYGTTMHLNVATAQHDVVNVFEKLGKYKEAEELCREMLATVIQYFDTTTNLDVAIIQESLAGILSSLGRYEEAIDLFQKALATELQFYGATAHMEVAMTQQNLAGTLNKLGRHKEAEKIYRDALSVVTQHYATTIHLDVAMIQQNLSATLEKLGQYEEAEQLSREALAVMIEHYGSASNIEVVTVQENLAGILSKLGKYQEMKNICQNLLAIKIQHYATTVHVEIAKTQRNLANALRLLGQYEEAEELCQKALAVELQFYSTRAHVEVAKTQNILAAILDSLGQYKEAKELYTEAIATEIEHYGTTVHIEIVHTQRSLANTLRQLGEYEEAEKLLRDALPVMTLYYGTTTHVEIARTQRNLADFLGSIGQYKEAEELHREALAIMIQHYGTTTNVDVATTQQNLAGILNILRQHKEAEKLCREALTTTIEYYGESHIKVASVQQNLAVTLDNIGQYDEAEKLFREALTVIIQHYKATHIEVARIQQNLGNILIKQKQYKQAEELCRNALATKILYYGSTVHIDLSVTQQSLAAILSKLERYEEAEALYREILSIQTQYYKTKNHLNVAITQQNFAAVLEKLKRFGEAETLYQEALATQTQYYGTATHLDVGITQFNLALLQINLGKFSLALEFITQCEYTFKTQMGGGQYLENCYQVKQFILEQLVQQQSAYASHKAPKIFQNIEPDKAIRRAAGCGEHGNLVVLLNQHPELLNVVDQNATKGWTALHWAIYNNHLHCVVELLNRNALYDISDRTTDAVTAIDIAIEKANPEISQVLSKHIIKKYIKTNERDSEKALRIAASTGDLPAVKLLIAQGVNIDASGPESGKTALHQAVQKKHPSVVKFLVNSGANANIEDFLGKKAVDYAEDDEGLITALSTVEAARMKK